MRHLILMVLLGACGGPCGIPSCDNTGKSEWCLIDEADGGQRVVGTP